MASAPRTTGPGRKQGIGAATRRPVRPIATGFGRGGNLRERARRRAELRNLASRVGRVQGA